MFGVVDVVLDCSVYRSESEIRDRERTAVKIMVSCTARHSGLNMKGNDGFPH